MIILKIIERPVLAVVISLIITLLGAISIFQMPIAQFPEIAPPEVNVTAEYTGSNAETSVKAVVRTLERSINGVPGMKYMSSDAGNDGTSVIQILFETGTDVDIAAVNVQNRVAEVIAQLPEEVRRNGVKVAKEINSILMYLNITCSDTTLDEKFIHNFAHINVLEELKRIEGIGFIDIMGQREYAIRVWLKPDRMNSYKISTDEVIAALSEYNIEAAPGKVGESSLKDVQTMQYILRYTGKFTQESEYENIPVKTDKNGQILRLKDIADIEFNTVFFDVRAKENGYPSAAIVIKQLPGSNANQVINKIKEKMVELKENTFLPGMDYTYAYDVSEFMYASFKKVLLTFIEAFIMVALVVFIFLQDFRSTLIPTLAVPVSIIGTFFFMQLFGFSINLITLFALILAIGIVVDNAIVVVEAVHTEIDKNDGNIKTATINAMKKISKAVISITLVMSAVYIPLAFMSGPVGIFYKQFSITLAVSIIISGISALTLTPALCTIILKRKKDSITKKKSIINKLLSLFNHKYNNLSHRYGKVIRLIANRRLITYSSLIIFSIFSLGIGNYLPEGFIPNEDQGTIYASILTPPGATLERTQKVVDEVQTIANTLNPVESVSTMAGTNLFSDGTGSPFGTVLINLKNWSDRKESVDEITQLMIEKTKHIKEANIDFIPPPAVPGYGNAAGFELRLLDKTGNDNLKELEIVLNRFISALEKRKEINSVFTLFENNYPQYVINVDYDEAAKRGITVLNAMNTLQTFLGSEWATDFIRYGKMFRVMVQSHPSYRTAPEDVLKLFVKNDAGEMVPLSSFVKLEKKLGPEQITRYNMYTSAEINGEPAPGFSSGDAINAIKEVAKETLPRGYDIAWAGISYDEVATKGQAIYIFFICLVFVYLILSAQYESFLLPLAVIFSLPIGMFGAFLLLMIFGLENNMYAQVAFIMLIGMLGKNAVLVVEYAMQREKEGFSTYDAAIQGASERLRPIIMTSFAFTGGLIPLMLATGAGSIGNNTIGTAAVGGMLFGTILGVIILPGLYYAFSIISKNTKGNHYV